MSNVSFTVVVMVVVVVAVVAVMAAVVVVVLRWLYQTAARRTNPRFVSQPDQSAVLPGDRGIQLHGSLEVGAAVIHSNLAVVLVKLRRHEP